MQAVRACKHPSKRRGQGAVMSFVEELDPIQTVLERLDEIQEALEILRENQEEILEKLDNLSLPTNGFQTYESIP